MLSWPRNVFRLPARRGAFVSGRIAGTSIFFYTRARESVSGLIVALALAGEAAAIEAPTSVKFDDISTHSITASAYVATPGFTGLGGATAGTNIAIGGTYAGWHVNGDKWTTKANVPTPRYESAAAVLGRKIYLLGGYSPSYHNENEEYDQAANTWLTKAPMPTARNQLCAAAVGGRIYAFGGTNGSPLALNEEYDPAANAWTTKANMPTARRMSAATAMGDKIYALGGDNGSVLDQNEGYDPSANTWTTKTAMPTPRYKFTATAAGNGKLYAAGGCASVKLSTNEEYDPAANAWSTKASMPTPRYAHAAALAGGKVYALGGYDPLMNVNEEYDPAANAWTTRAPMPTTRDIFSAAAAGGKVYALGGVTSPYNQNEEYDPGVATVFAGLEPNTQYTFKAKARDSSGVETGETANISTYTLAVASLPLAGTPPFTVHYTSMTVRWSSGTVSNNMFNGPGARYLVQASTCSDFDTIAASSNTANIWAGMTALKIPTTYYFRIQAYNAVGATDFSWFYLGYETPYYLPTGCGSAYNVRKDGMADYTGIQDAVDAVPGVLVGTACVVIRDTATYFEQVTVRGFTNNNFRVQIMGDPGFVSSAPVVSPPAASTAAFEVRNDSVTIMQVDVAPVTSMQYGVMLSSNICRLSKVDVLSPSNHIWRAGISI
ncbi:MAG: hypothetical protein PHF00_13615, partial [Elusimicrobia bacterium]|nr:hypothetical protein [Elusimicrobiota bacterium]